MDPQPTTRASLLVRLRNPQDHTAWQRFVDVYTPLIYGYARRRGLQEADAADVTQDVLLRVSSAAGKLQYDPERGSFCGWLCTLVHHRVYDFIQSARRRATGTGDTAAQLHLEQQPAAEWTAEWDEEWRHRLFHCAAELVRGEFAAASWEAFWRTAVEGQKPGETANALGLSIGAVYIAKSRVLTRLKAAVQELEEAECSQER